MRRTATERTHMVHTAIHNAGYAGHITSSPWSHTRHTTWVTSEGDLESIAAYLDGYLGDLASVNLRDGFVCISWD